MTRWALALLILGALVVPGDEASGKKGKGGGGGPGNTTPLDILYTAPAGSGYGTLYAMQDDGTGATALADTRGGATWSPDGTQVAFYGVQDGFGIYLMDVDGGSPQKLISIDGLTAGYLDWSPVVGSDGTNELAFTARPSSSSGGADVYVAQFDDSGLLGMENVTNTPSYNERWPTWSPDGGQIAVEYHSQIRIIDLADRDASGIPSNHVVYQSSRFDPGQVAWSKTGSQIAFLAYDADFASNGGTGLSDIFVFQASHVSGAWTGSNPVNITNSSNDEENSLLWSPDDSSLLIANAHWRRIGKGTSRGSLQILHLASGARETLLGSGGHAYPTWKRSDP